MIVPIVAELAQKSVTNVAAQDTHEALTVLRKTNYAKEGKGLTKREKFLRRPVHPAFFVSTSTM